MSRIGRKPVDVPEKVKVDVAGTLVKVNGPLGQLNQTIPEGVTIEVEGNVLTVGSPEKTRANRGYQGMVRSLIHNMVVGVSEGYEKKLEINGVGYKAEQSGDTLTLSLGLSHQVHYKLPEGVKAELAKNTQLTIKGIDKQVVGQVAAQIRSFRPPEPYKGKGVKYADEQIRRKVGKAGVK
jgi:large subunit ribosomal protein L6